MAFITLPKLISSLALNLIALALLFNSVDKSSLGLHWHSTAAHPYNRLLSSFDTSHISDLCHVYYHDELVSTKTPTVLCSTNLLVRPPDENMQGT